MPGVALGHAPEGRPDQRQIGEIGELEQRRAQAVVEIVVGVGDVVGERGDLGLGARVRGQFQIVLGAVARDVGRHPAGQRPVVLDHALERLPGQVEAVELGVATLEEGDHPQRLGVVVEAALGLEHGIERILAGVAEGAVAEVVGERHRLGQILVEAERARRGTGDLRDLERVGEPGAEMIALVADEHLGLVLEAPERGAVDDPVAVALEGAAQRLLGLEMAPPPASLRIAGIGCQRPAGAAVEGKAAV